MANYDGLINYLYNNPTAITPSGGAGGSVSGIASVIGGIFNFANTAMGYWNGYKGQQSATSNHSGGAYVNVPSSQSNSGTASLLSMETLVIVGLLLMFLKR